MLNVAARLAGDAGSSLSLKSLEVLELKTAGDNCDVMFISSR